MVEPRKEGYPMKTKAKVLFGAFALAVGMAGFAFTAMPPTASAHETGPSGGPAVRTVHGPNSCDTIAPDLRTWCTQCVSLPGQHYHPDCPSGARCSPNNGQAQCGGGQF